MKLLITLLLLTTQIFAQTSPSSVCEVDYFNATRYVGSRNLARSTNGEVVVVFEPGSAYFDNNQEIHYVTYNSIFGNWDPATALSQSSDNATGIPSVAANDNGQIMATWKELVGETGVRELMFSTFSGGIWSDPMSISDASNVGVNTINIADDGSMAVIWSVWDKGTSYPANIYVTSSANGENWTSANLTSEFPTPDELPFEWLDVDIAPAKNGKWYAAWEDKAQPYTNQYEVILSEYEPAAGWSLPEIISPLNDGVPGFQNYVDGVTPRAEAKSLYQLGPADYPLAGTTSALQFDNGHSEVIAFLFNLYYQLPVTERLSLVQDVMTHFTDQGVAKIMVVDDDNAYNNETILYDALGELGISYENFDCGNAGGMPLYSPSDSLLQAQDLVIWFAGDEYSTTAFWATADTVNTELENYLNTNGKKFWMIGRSLIYDRYNDYPVTFEAGDFCYDYLGINSFDVQSKQDDGGTGVTELNLVAGNGILSVLETIRWGNTGIRQGAPSIASAPDGVPYLAYEDDNGDHIRFMKYTAGTWSEPIQIDTSPDTVSVTRPSIAVDKNYGVYVVWQQVTNVDDGGIGTWNVFYATSPDGGANWNAPVQLSTTTYVNGINESVRNANVARKVYDSDDIPGFDGGAEVIWTEANEASSLGYYIKYGRIPYVGTLTSVDERVPVEISLNSVYPNPFNAATVLSFTLAHPGTINLNLYNVNGQLVRKISQGFMNAGTHKIHWNADGIASGIYLLKLEANGVAPRSRKLLLVK